MRKQGKEMISTRGKEEEETRIHHQGLSKSNQSYVMPELASEDQKRWDKHCAQRLRSRPTVHNFSVIAFVGIVRLVPILSSYVSDSGRTRHEESAPTAKRYSQDRVVYDKKLV
ncbi:hypothetical protein KCU87_g75, partial [Aureobasidium melanogenum]